MPKATIEFNLPEEKHEFDMCNKTSDYCCAIDAFTDQIRQWYKYEQKESVDMEILRSTWFDILAEFGVET